MASQAEQLYNATVTLANSSPAKAVILASVATYKKNNPKLDNLSGATSLYGWAKQKDIDARKVVSVAPPTANNIPPTTATVTAPAQPPVKTAAQIQAEKDAANAKTKTAVQGVLNQVTQVANLDASLKDKILKMLSDYKTGHPNLTDKSSADTLLAQAQNLVLNHQKELQAAIDEEKAKTAKVQASNKTIQDQLNNPALAGVSKDVTSSTVPAINTAVADYQKQQAALVLQEQKAQQVLQYAADNNTATTLGVSGAGQAQQQTAGDGVGGVDIPTNLPGGLNSISAGSVGFAANTAGTGGTSDVTTAPSSLPFGVTPMQLLFAVGIVVAGFVTFKSKK